MKVCPKCTCQNEDTSVFCIKCGERLIESGENTPEHFQPASDFMGKAGNLLNSGTTRAKEAAADLQKSIADRKAIETETRKGFSFVDQSETAVAIIGNNYFQDYLIAGRLAKGFAILTQKRFYYMGKQFFGGGKNMTSSTTEGIVAVEDICYTEFKHVRLTGFLLTAILLTILGICLLSLPIGKFILIAAIPFYVTFFVKKDSQFVIYFPGGWFSVKISWYPISDIQDFQRQLHLLKDHIKEEQRA